MVVGSESGSMLSEPTVQPVIMQLTAVSSNSSRTLIPSRSSSGELICIDAMHSDSSASESMCSLLTDGATGYLYVGPVPSVEDLLYEHRSSH